MKSWSSIRNDAPLILVIGGPSGAGKTTTAHVLLPQALAIDQFVNADMIAQGLSPFAPRSTALEAGYLMLNRIHELADHGESFGFETTMTSRSYRAFLAAQQRTEAGRNILDQETFNQIRKSYDDAKKAD